MEHENKLVQDRINKLNELKKLGINPYPYTFDVKDQAIDLLNKYKLEPKEESDYTATVAGRIMGMRKMGKIAFMHILDETARIQIFLNTETKGFDHIKLLDVGDWIGVTGLVFATRSGETTIKASEFTILCKNIQPLPEKYHGLKDVELRYRQRYVDLFVNPEVREVFRKRTVIIHKIKDILIKEGFIEAETPVLQPVYGGANAKPFETFHNDLKMKMYLRVSNELYLKRLLVGGLGKVFEFVKDFRNEGIDTTHNPEFTQVEWYEAYKDYNRGMELFETIYEECAKAVNDGSTIIEYQGTKIDYKAPWPRVKMVDAIKEHTGLDVLNMSTEELADYCNKEKLEVQSKLWGVYVQTIFEEKCESNYVQPTFIIDHPIESTPLCKQTRYDERFVERFEPYCNTWELGNAYSELNDPILQKKLLHDQVERGRGGEDETHPMDEDFITAMEYGMPPASGVGIGIDRMVMLLTNSPSIRDVIFFPTLKPNE